MKNKSRKIFSGILSLVLVLIMMIGIVPMSASAAYENTHSNTGDQRFDIVEIAKTQIGNSSSTKYGGASSWCAQFVVWCARQAGVGEGIIKTTGLATADDLGVAYYGRNADRSEGINYTPKSGDLIIFDWSSNGYCYKSPASSYGDHVGIVEYVADGYVHTIEGNSGKSNPSVKRQTYSLSSSEIKGYGVPNYGSSGGTTHTHSYSDTVVAPTCTTQGYTTHTCSSCGDSYTDSYVNALGHNEGNWTTTVYAKCTTQGTEKIFCTRCGDELNSRQTSSLGHCESGWITTVEPKCLTEGTEKIFCTRCEDELNSRQIDALGHDYASEVIVEATCKGKGQMKYVCKRCNFTCYDIIEPKGHNHNEAIWTTTVAATCTTAGEQTAYCPDCTELIDTRVIPKLGHDNGTWTVTTQPTCTDKGEENCYCTRCGKATEKRSIEALGHDNGTWVITTQPTCTNKGEETCYCTRCGKATDKRSIEALEHDTGVWKIDFEATANHDGQMSRYCTCCNEALETKTFKMHKHIEGYRETVIEPTCTTGGEGGVFCASCGVKFGTYAISALGHDYNDWYTNNNGTHSHTCSRCHNFESANCDYDVTVKEATCTESGYTTHTCKICNYTYIDGNIDALGHSWSEWADTEDGMAHTRSCLNCGITETEEHVWGEWVLNKDAKLFRNGTKTHTCEVCGISASEKAIHTAWIIRVPYTIIVWIGSLLKKIGYIISFKWFLPDHGITPIH